VPTEKGNANGGMQPPTLMFCMAGVDTEKLRLAIANAPPQARTYLTDFIPAEYFGQNHQFIVVGLRELIAQAQKERGLKKGEVWINMTRVKGTDGTDARSLTNGEIEGRHQIDDIVTYLVNYVAGFENSYFTKTAPFIGIRETRRIVGEYVMTQEDVLACKHFDDAIAVASYPIDIHRPADDGCTLIWCGDCYDIPYRSLVPQKVSNLLVAGRSISATHEAMGAIRVMATCMAMGEAAGRAAKISVRGNRAPADIDVEELRRQQLERGVYLRNPDGTRATPDRASKRAA
jgi:hypothetical protein